MTDIRTILVVVASVETTTILGHSIRPWVMGGPTPVVTGITQGNLWTNHSVDFLTGMDAQRVMRTGRIGQAVYGRMLGRDHQMYDLFLLRTLIALV